MDYVCTVIGSLSIRDLHLDLSYMEIIDLSSEDFKSTPQLRDCLRGRQLEVYVPNKYPLAKKFRDRNSAVKPIEIPKQAKTTSIEGLPEISKNLNEVSTGLSNALTKIDLLIESFQSYATKISVAENPSLTSLIDKIDKLIEVLGINNDSAKFDILINKFDNFISKNPLQSFIMSSGPSIDKNKSFVSETPLYVPELSLSDFGKKNIKAKEETAEGTDDILEKLKQLKNK